MSRNPSIEHHKRRYKLKLAPFLGLARELRDVIYRDLLIVDRYKVQSILTCNHNLHSAILRVCKKIYKEAKEILYGENCWIEITMDRPTYEDFVFHHKHQFLSYTNFPVVNFAECEFPQRPALRLKLQTLPLLWTGSLPTSHCMVISLAALPRFCRMIANQELLREEPMIEINLVNAVKRS